MVFYSLYTFTFNYTILLFIYTSLATQRYGQEIRAAGGLNMYTHVFK